MSENILPHLLKTITNFRKEAFVSTKISFYYQADQDSYTHFYEDLAEPEKFFLEKTVTTDVKYQFTLEELCLLAKSIDLQELKRQSNISDQEIIDYVKKNVVERIKKQDSFCGMFGSLVYGTSSDPEETQVQTGIAYFTKIRNNLKNIVSILDRKRIDKISFGMF